LFTQIICDEAYNLWISALCSLLLPPATYSHLGWNIFLNTMFSITCNIRACSSLSERERERDQVSYPYKTTGKIMALWVSESYVKVGHYRFFTSPFANIFLKLFGSKLLLQLIKVDTP
jgi:hypothetical protein